MDFRSFVRSNKDNLPDDDLAQAKKYLEHQGVSLYGKVALTAKANDIAYVGVFTEGGRIEGTLLEVSTMGSSGVPSFEIGVKGVRLPVVVIVNDVVDIIALD